MKCRFRTKVWWPKIDDQVEKMIKSCRGFTLVSSPFAPYPMKMEETPSGPWIDIAIVVMSQNY